MLTVNQLACQQLWEVKGLVSGIVRKCKQVVTVQPGLKGICTILRGGLSVYIRML